MAPIDSVSICEGELLEKIAQDLWDSFKIELEDCQQVEIREEERDPFLERPVQIHIYQKKFPENLFSLNWKEKIQIALNK